MKISEIITDKYKLLIPPTVYYDLMADVREAEEEQEPCEDVISRQVVEEMIKAEMPERGMWEIDGDKEKETVCEVCVDLIQKLSQLPPVTPQQKIGQTGWIPVSERLPELNRPLLVTAYHRVYYGHLISESGNYGYPVFRIHGLGDKNRDWVQETMSHGPYSLGRIDAWMYLDIPEPYRAEGSGE